ncbi:MAG: hypothetical protein CL557_17695 [Alphaproteobacteria bacterium]|nr:hypothetical protein [Alphaproteobacteria bacterium]
MEELMIVMILVLFVMFQSVMEELTLGLEMKLTVLLLEELGPVQRFQTLRFMLTKMMVSNSLVEM